jgi:hypothetical protein
MNPIKSDELKQIMERASAMRGGEPKVLGKQLDSFIRSATRLWKTLRRREIELEADALQADLIEDDGE